MKAEIEEIFTYWQQTCDHRIAKLIPVRKRLIAARLREGYTVDNIKEAIDGCRRSAFHQGDNPEGKIYDDLTLICRNGAKLEQFIAYNKVKRPPRNPDRFPKHQPEPNTAKPVCSICKGRGFTDSHPDNAGFVPGRQYSPCPSCSKKTEKR